MLKLLGRATSGNVQKVVFLLEHLGVAYEREDYGKQFGNTSGDYLKMNPNGKVPTLQDGDLTIWESNTILRYVAASQNSELYPSNLATRTHIERWMDWVLASVNFHYVSVFKGSKLAAAEREAGYEASAKELASLLAILDDHLANSSWLAGDALSLADVALGPVIRRCIGFDIDRPKFANLDRWHGALEQLPAFTKAVNP